MKGVKKFDKCVTYSTSDETIHLFYLCLAFVMLSRLFIAALWSPAGKGLTSWLLFVMFNCIIFTLKFPCGILGQVWYLIVSIPDLRRLSYMELLPIEEDIVWCLGSQLNI